MTILYLKCTVSLCCLLNDCIRAISHLHLRSFSMIIHVQCNSKYTTLFTNVSSGGFDCKQRHCKVLWWQTWVCLPQLTVCVGVFCSLTACPLCPDVHGSLITWVTWHAVSRHAEAQRGPWHHVGPSLRVALWLRQYSHARWKGKTHIYCMWWKDLDCQVFLVPYSFY